MRVAIATCVHHPLDARIYARQIEALLGAGHDVAYAAPFTATGTPADERLECHDVPRAVGLRRRHAVAMTTAWMRAVSTDVDVLLVHDIELARVLCKFPVSAAAVWDVHENNPEAIASRPYLPRMLRPFVRSLARRWEQRAEDSLRLILAETSYLARFTQPHPVVLNLPWVDRQPDVALVQQLTREVVYVGSITQARGVREMIDLASLLEPDGIGVTLIGPVDDECA
ncbi:MAG: glycosyl transferase, partial [Actinomycetes bacterium]